MDLTGVGESLLPRPTHFSVVLIVVHAAPPSSPCLTWKSIMAIRNPPSWMWAEACEMLERAQQLQRQFYRFGRSVDSTPRWEPPIDILAYGNEVHVAVALPGVAADR